MKKIIKRIILFLVIINIGILNCSAAELNCNYILRKGSKGTKVADLQKVLNDKMGCNLSIDKSFGSLTKKCVQEYQQAHNLEVDGIVGPKTCKSLNEESETINNKITSVIKEYETSSKILAVTIGSKVNVRKNATTTSKVVGKVRRGDIVTVYERNENWYYVEINGIQGYIRSDLIALNCIVVDISDQIFYYYKDGNLSWSTNVVTGNEGNHDTPVGSYILNKSNYKTATYLKGTNDNGTTYKSYVDYWMPFILTRGIGFHDASWRATWEFNSTRYKGNGSHGCVNMQHEAAEKLYNEELYSINVIIRN